MCKIFYLEYKIPHIGYFKYNTRDIYMKISDTIQRIYLVNKVFYFGNPCIIHFISDTLNSISDILLSI